MAAEWEGLLGVGFIRTLSSKSSFISSEIGQKELMMGADVWAIMFLMWGELWAEKVVYLSQ